MVSAAPASKRNRIYVEVRECEGCNHIGINDAHSAVGACHECDWSGPEPVEDKCPGCGRENVMAAACPDCGSRYVLATSKEFEVPAPQPHPEPIAWIVGTAIWWTKEEAERDAAATGLPIVGLGPMTDAGAIERLVAANTEYARRHLEHQGEVERLRSELAQCEAMAAMIADREWAEHVGTGPVSSKVEAAFTQLHNDLHEADEKLAERDALLTDIEKRHWSGVDFDLPADLVTRIKAISVSAEPEATS